MVRVGRKKRISRMSLWDGKTEKRFPKLTRDNYQRHSPWDRQYNCIAFAAGDSWRLWSNAAYWPPGVNQGHDFNDLVEAYLAIGFVHCGVALDIEIGFEKVALYWTPADGEWTHAAHSDTMDGGKANLASPAI